jgi:hypothetical protein
MQDRVTVDGVVLTRTQVERAMAALQNSERPAPGTWWLCGQQRAVVADNAVTTAVCKHYRDLGLHPDTHVTLIDLDAGVSCTERVNRFRKYWQQIVPVEER